MRSKSIGAVVAAFLSLSLCHAQNPANNSDSIINRLERELASALLKGDTATLDRIVANNYIEINAQGGVRKKVDVIAIARARSAVRQGVSIGPEKTLDELSIRSYADSALVVGRTTIRYQFMENQTLSSQAQQAPVIVDQERFIRTYAKVDGRWQLVAWQTTAIAKQ